jgi:CSLREA domain-containing protein
LVGTTESAQAQSPEKTQNPQSTNTSPQGTNVTEDASAQAADNTFTVNSTADDNDGACTPTKCTLRDATNAANAATGSSGIVFSLPSSSTIQLSSTLPAIASTKRVNINGIKAPFLKISGSSLTFSLFTVDSGATLILRNLTVANGGSAGSGGGAVLNQGTLTALNSTFSDNAGFSGGAIYNVSGTLTVTNSTFLDNTTTNKADIDNFGTATLSNTILAHSSTSGTDCLGTITDGGYNIADDNTCGFSQNNNSKNNTNPLLDPNGLKNNGGPTKTIALQPGSPAINAIPQGTNGCGTTIDKDQRGVMRPQGPGCDVGAFELQNPPSGGGGGGGRHHHHGHHHRHHHHH